MEKRTVYKGKHGRTSINVQVRVRINSNDGRSSSNERRQDEEQSTIGMRTQSESRETRQDNASILTLTSPPTLQWSTNQRQRKRTLMEMNEMKRSGELENGKSIDRTRSRGKDIVESSQEIDERPPSNVLPDVLEKWESNVGKKTSNREKVKNVATKSSNDDRRTDTAPIPDWSNEGRRRTSTPAVPDWSKDDGRRTNDVSEPDCDIPKLPDHDVSPPSPHLEKEEFEPVIPRPAKLRKCCECCPKRHVKKCRSSESRSSTKSKSKSEPSEKTTIGNPDDDRAICIERLDNDSSAMQRAVKMSIAQAIEVDCPICGDAFTVFVDPDPQTDDTMFGIQDAKEWRKSA